jgi:hypothetical protein
MKALDSNRSLGQRQSVSLIRKNWAFLAGALLVLLYFCYFVLPSLGTRFRNDDALNIYYYWSRGFWALIQGIVLFFTTYYRPMGGVYFYSLYEIFGLDPLPYHVVVSILFLINVILVYRCATLLSGSKIIGGLCSILMTYHANMALLLYAPAFVFDVLCFTFYFAAFFFYLRIRCSGRELNARQILIFVLFYITALESKEMAVSLPVMVLAYEMLWHTPGHSGRCILRWLRTTGLPTLAAGIITVWFIIGKSIGDEALGKNPAYQATITFERFFESNVRYVKAIFYLKPEGWFNEQWLLIVWALLAYVAISRRSDHLKFSVIMILIAPLPIAFLPDRGGAMLYIPCFAWALVLATFIETVCDSVSREPLFRRLPLNLAKALPLLLAVGWIWHQTDFKHERTKYSLPFIGREFSLVKEQLTALLPKVKPGTQIVFYNDIFQDWDAKFIAELLYKDRSVNVRLNDKTPLSRSELDRADYVLAFEQEKLVILKRPGEDFKPPE